MSQKPHFFLAVRLPKLTSKLLEKVTDDIKHELRFKSWVHPADYHITLAFLGAIDQQEALSLVEGKMNEITQLQAIFDLTLSNLGTFGRADSPRIFWVGVEKSDALHQLQQQVFHACTNIGFQLDSRPFYPHITVARKWNGDGLFSLERQGNASVVDLKGEVSSFHIEEFVLYQTRVDQLPKYQPIAIFPFKGR